MILKKGTRLRAIETKNKGNKTGITIGDILILVEDFDTSDAHQECPWVLNNKGITHDAWYFHRYEVISGWELKYVGT